MSPPARMPYPPCQNDVFGCPGLEHKHIWPELVGKPGQEAKAIIEKENPMVTGVIVKPGTVIIDDYCCNRVLIKVDGHGHVHVVPFVG